MDAEKVEKVASGLERLTKSSNCPFVVYDAVSVIRELKAENERLRQEKDDAVKRITEEIDLNPAYEPDCGYTSEIITFNYQLGYQEGLQKALNIINEP